MSFTARVLWAGVVVVAAGVFSVSAASAQEPSASWDFGKDVDSNGVLDAGSVVPDLIGQYVNVGANNRVQVRVSNLPEGVTVSRESIDYSYGLSGVAGLDFYGSKQQARGNDPRPLS